MRKTRSYTDRLPKKKVPPGNSVYPDDLSTNGRVALANRMAKMPVPPPGPPPPPIRIRKSGTASNLHVTRKQRPQDWKTTIIGNNNKTPIFKHLSSISNFGTNPFLTGYDTHIGSPTASNESYNGAKGKPTKRKPTKSKPKKRRKTGGSKPPSINLLSKTRKRKQKKTRRP